MALVAFGAANAQDFNGFYVGANAGGAFGRFDAKLSTVFSPTGYFASSSVPAIATVGNQKIEPNGFSVGGGAGFGHVWDNFYFGLEADFQTMNLNGSKTGSATYPCCAPTAFTITQTTETNWLFTIRPRVGWVAGKALLYTTVGPAFTKVKYSALFTDTFATAHESAAFDQGTVGYAAGGGVEFKLSPHWSVKGEYLYLGFNQTDIPSQNLTAFTGPVISFPSNIFQHTVDLTTQIARGGINFRF